jgi:pimeloyl-ACP methyl ester carboxylesterase
MLHLILLLAIACAVAPAVAAPAIDSAREDRWAEEVVPAIVVGDAVWLATPSRAKVLAILAMPTERPKGGAILIHGLGVHPDFGMIGGLRTRLADAGYATLSVQMPVLAAGASREDYAIALPAAAERIDVAIAFLRANGIAPIAIVAHSFGAVMADAYLARANARRIDAWVQIGMLAEFTADPREPVLDVVAASDFPEVLAAAPLRAKRLPRDGCSRALVIAGADHYFGTSQQELAAAVATFLDRVAAKEC